MKEKGFMLLFLMLGLSLSAQLKGIVVDEKNNPIPFVNIWVEGENSGTTSEENGTFSINTSKEKNLVFSTIGYEMKTIKAIESKKVVLKPIVFELNEVVIFKPKNSIELEIGTSNNRFYLPEPQVVPWIFSRKFTIDKKNTEIKYLKKLVFYTKSKTNEAIFRVRIFKVNNEGNPDEDLISESIIVQPKKGQHKTIVDVSAFKIEVPADGIIIGFESLLTESNKYMQEVRVNNSKQTSKVLNYGPYVMYCYDSKEESYTYRNGKWIKQKYSMFPEKSNEVITPAITIILTN